MTTQVQSSPTSGLDRRGSQRDLGARGLKSAAALSEARPHGTRLKYVGGCRCTECRAANTQYERDRAKARKEGDWNGIVDATPARLHIEKLAAQNVGRRAIGAATDIGDTILSEIKAGTRRFIRARTARKILAVTVDCRADHALVSAKRLWRCVRDLVDAGYTKAALATELGFKRPALQFGKDWVTVKNEADVVNLHRRLLGEGGLVSSAASAKRLATLLDEQFRPEMLKARLGFPLELKKKILARHADAIAALYDELMQ